MRILRVIDTLDRRTGGPATGLRALAPELARLGHETVIVTVDPPGPADDVPGATVVRLGPARGGYRRAPRLAPWLARHVGGFDAAIVHGLWQSLGRTVRRAARAPGLPSNV
jgi:hypothetical protein